jgi:phytoene dehydrogenase-like protein
MSGASIAWTPGSIGIAVAALDDAHGYSLKSAGRAKRGRMVRAVHDIVVVGGGHNTLTTAAYLARCGLGVLVLEKNELPGGGVITQEVTAPGYLHDIHANGIAHLQAHPIVTHDELGLLSRYGLKFAYPEASFMTIFGDGEQLCCFQSVDRSCAEIARFSTKDADSYRRIVRFMETVGPLMAMSLSRPPPPFGSFITLLEKAPFGNELLMALMKSAYDVVIENFEHPKVRIHFLKWAAEALCAPEEKTTGINMFFLIGASHSHPAGAVIGGSQCLTRSMIRAIEDCGGEIRCGTAVRRIINRAGVANAVELADGSTIEARRAVVAAIHPHLLGDMVQGLDEGLVRRAKNTHTSGYSEMVVHGALKEKIRWKAGEQPNNCLAINLVDEPDMETFRRIFDDLRYGELPKSFICSLGVHSNYDPSRAPAGGHTLWADIFVPFALKNGGSEAWADVKHTHAARFTERIARYTHNLSADSYAGLHVQSPVDMVNHSPSFQQGDIMGLGSYSYQSLGLRPTAELAQYRVPGARGLYLAGPFMHPGGGVTGGGRAVAMRIMEDLGCDYSKVIRS